VVINMRRDDHINQDRIAGAAKETTSVIKEAAGGLYVTQS
jgi:hypothetical protein